MTAERVAEIDPDELPPGTVLLGGRLTIDHRIGRGGMSTVYACTTDRHRTVAAKIIASEYAHDLTVRERFRNEARLAQALAGHPRIVTPYEVGEAPELGGRLYMTMPIIKGTPLSLLADRRAWKRWVAVMADVATTVADLHDRGIVHRDIKPSNVILGVEHGRDVPYLLDFGFAWSKGDGDVPATAGMTRSDECPGTKLYMAPEQALGHPTAPSFDVYALALSLYELVAGMHPLEGMTANEAVRRKCDRERPSLSLRDHRPDLPRELLDAVDRALERDPSRRTPSAAAFAEQLEHVLVGHGEQSARQRHSDPISVVGLSVQRDPARPEPSDSDLDMTRHGAMEPAAAPPRHGWGRWLVGALVVVLLAVGAGWAAWPRGPGDGTSIPTATKPSMGAREAAAMANGDILPSVLAAEEDPPTAGEDPLPSEEPTDGSEMATASDPDASDDETPPEPTPARDREVEPPKVKTPAVDSSSAECAATRNAAEVATTRRDWQAVLGATARPRCWSATGLWRALRVQALHGLGKYRACVRTARHATDTTTLRTSHLCEAALANRGGLPPARDTP